jgi:Zn-dependent peptidase ImmA (M78 family)
VEELGVFSFQTAGLDVAEARGFALANSHAPVVVINGNDSYSARTFTLLHEVTHILLGISAVSGNRIIAHEPQAKIERYCNRLAAETLVPAEDFAARFQADWMADDERYIAEVAKQYHVSRSMILLRLLEVGLVGRDYVQQKWASYQLPAKDRAKDRPIPQHVLALARGGRAFARLALSAYNSDLIHGGELAGLLRLKLKHLPKLVSKLNPTRVSIDHGE